MRSSGLRNGVLSANDLKMLRDLFDGASRTDSDIIHKSEFVAMIR